MATMYVASMHLKGMTPNHLIAKYVRTCMVLPYHFLIQT